MLTKTLGREVAQDQFSSLVLPTCMAKWCPLRDVLQYFWQLFLPDKVPLKSAEVFYEFQSEFEQWA